ncbi:MAG: hypothetical protein ACI4OT_02455 [Bacilli bacterium]
MKQLGVSEKEAYLTYYSLILNKNLTDEDKLKISGYIQYFIDNKYLNEAEVFTTLKNLAISDKYIEDAEWAGLYDENENKIFFDSEKAKEECITIFV